MAADEVWRGPGSALGPSRIVQPKLDFLVDFHNRVPARYWTPDT